MANICSATSDSRSNDR